MDRKNSTTQAVAEIREVLGDRDELIRVFENLIENALKYGAAGKRVDITVAHADLPEGVSKRLHLHARRIVFPHPRDGIIDISAPLPEHMLKTFDLFGFDPNRFEDDEE